MKKVARKNAYIILWLSSEKGMDINMEAKKQFQVIVVGGGTSGIVAAIAAARAGAKTALIEMKGYVGGTVVEGGTALHSFFNSYGRFQVPKV